MTRFKVGDRVRCLSAWAGMVVGSIYTVSGIHSEDKDGQFVVLKECLESHPSHNARTSRLELVVETKQRCVPSGGPGTQLDKVLKLTLGQGSWTLGGIAAATGASEAAASARLRDLRAQGYTVTCAKEKGEKLRHYTVRSTPIALPA